METSDDVEMVRIEARRGQGSGKGTGLAIVASDARMDDGDSSEANLASKGSSTEPSSRFHDVLKSATRSTQASLGSWDSSTLYNEDISDEPLPLSFSAAADRERIFRQRSQSTCALAKDSKWRIVRNYLSVIRAMKQPTRKKSSRRKGKPRCVLMPDAPLKRFQDFLMLVALLYV